MSHPLVVNIKNSGCDIYVGRPTKWGNPFYLGNESDRERILEDYLHWIARKPELIADAKRELRGKVLGCHCAPKACHADILARIANA